jgi:hypothetical protein
MYWITRCCIPVMRYMSGATGVLSAYEVYELTALSSMVTSEKTCECWMRTPDPTRHRRPSDDSSTTELPPAMEGDHAVSNHDHESDDPSSWIVIIITMLASPMAVSRPMTTPLPRVAERATLTPSSLYSQRLW